MEKHRQQAIQAVNDCVGEINPDDFATNELYEAAIDEMLRELALAVRQLQALRSKP